MCGAWEGSWTAVLECTAQRCYRCLQKAAQGGSRAAFWSVFESTRSKGSRPELAKVSGAACCCLSSPPALPTRVLILILHLPFALP